MHRQSNTSNIIVSDDCLIVQQLSAKDSAILRNNRQENKRNRRTRTSDGVNYFPVRTKFRIVWLKKYDHDLGRGKVTGVKSGCQGKFTKPKTPFVTFINRIIWRTEKTPPVEDDHVI